MKSSLAHSLLLCSSSLFFTSLSAHADETKSSEEKDIEVINVIGSQAYRGNFTALETPQSELLLDSELLQNAGAFDLVQALDLSSSVARQNNFGGLWNSFAIRGFVGDGNLPSNFLVNGFNAGRGFGGPRDLSGIEAVEVLKGPRAALFGRGEPGGTINLVTKRPNFTEGGELRVSGGSYATYRADADYQTTVSDNLSVRLVGFYEDAESFRDTIETKRFGFSPSIALQIDDSSKLVYELEYSDQEIPFDRGVIAINNELGLIPDSTFLGEPGDGPIETQVVGHQLEYQKELNDNWSLLLGASFRDTSLIGFATENGFGAPDADGNFGRFRRFRDYNAEYYVLRGELTGSFKTGNLDHRVIIGIDSDEFENDQLALRDRSTDQSINIFNPVFGAFPLPTLTLENNPNIDQVETQESKGIYIQDQISITDKLDIRIGARFDDYQQELIARRSGNVSNFDESRLSPQIGAVYKATESLSVYATYGENFRPLTGATNTNNLEPNESRSSELGLNFSLNNGALVGTLAIFDVRQSNISTVDQNFNATAIGSANSQGVEFDLNGQLSDSISLFLSYSYIDAETENAFNDPDFGTEVPAGSSLLNIPEHQLSMQVVKYIQMAGRELSLIGGLIYVDDRNGFFSDQSFRLPSYTTVQVAANYQLSDALQIRAEINNLFDEEYFTNSFANVWVQPGTPTTARLTASYRF